jgi:hypothetical protein
MRSAREHEVERLFAVAREFDAIGDVRFLERSQGELEVAFAVLDQQDFNR